MADWVATNKPYQKVDLVELRTGTVLRRVPFSAELLTATTFGVEREGKREKLHLVEVDQESEVARFDKVVVSPGIVLTPDCDIFQHKGNRVVVAQVVSVASHIKNQGLSSDRAKRLRDSIDRARSTSPGAFTHAGLFPLLAENELGFEDHLVLLENITSIPIQFAGENQGMAVTDESVCGLDNLWFWIQHPELRARLVNEFARHMLRIGLQDA